MTGGDLRELGSSNGCGIRTTLASSLHGGSAGGTTSTSAGYDAVDAHAEQPALKSLEMGKTAVGVLYVVAMAAVVVAVDVLIFRSRVWERLAANVGIVLVFAAFYFRFLHHP